MSTEMLHMERDPMVRDAVKGKDKDLESYLGRLQPKIGGTAKPTRDYGPDQHGIHLSPAAE